MRLLRGLAIVLLLIGCAAFARGRDRPDMTPARPALTFVQDADSTRLQGSWSAVLDAAGRAVPTYLWRIHRNGITVDSGNITSTTVRRTYPNPTPGDSSVYRLSVIAIDARGVQSQPGLSPNVVVRSPWTAPPAPIVGLDTLAAAPAVPIDSISLVVVMEDGTVTQNPVFTRAGETAQGCVIEWVGRSPRLAAGQAPECHVVGVMLGQFPANPQRSS